MYLFPWQRHCNYGICVLFYLFFFLCLCVHYEILALSIKANVSSREEVWLKLTACPRKETRRLIEYKESWLINRAVWRIRHVKGFAGILCNELGDLLLGLIAMDIRGKSEAESLDRAAPGERRRHSHTTITLLICKFPRPMANHPTLRINGLIYRRHTAIVHPTASPVPFSDQL